VDIPNTPKDKKPYASPELTVYGTVEDLTRTAGNTGTGDGGFVSLMQKTSP